MSMVRIPTSCSLPPLCLGFCRSVGSNLFHYIQTAHLLVISLATEFVSQVLRKGLRGALQIQRHIFVAPINLSSNYTAPHVPLPTPGQVVVII